MIYKVKKTSYLLFLSIVTGFLATSCSSDDVSGTNDSVSDEIILTGSVFNPGSIQTRKPSEDSTTFIAYNPYTEDFYIRMFAKDSENKDFKANGTYIVESGYEGRLISKNSNQSLNWQSLRGDHTFYGWTFPSGGYIPPTQGAEMQTYQNNPYATFDTDNVTDELKPPTIEFKNSSEADGYQVYHNNDIYETFIGVKEGPVKYVVNGTYVPLIFKHLVSKILVKEIILNNSGSIQKHLKCDLSFYGIPSKATFYPLGFKNEEKNIEIDEPVVLPNLDKGEYKLEDQLTFYIENQGENDYVYIPPEIDFSQLAFSVSISSTESGYNGLRDFSGNFHNVVFERSTTGENWDDPDGGDDTILHAGEMMILRIILYPGGGGGLFVQILPWSTDKPGNAPHYSHQGIYSDNALNDIARAADSTEEDFKQYFDLYGSQNEKNEDVFNLYENCNLTEANLRVHNNYILEGNGHVITVKTSPLEVRNVRNLYLTDGKGNYVYIDSEGKIYKISKETMEIIEPYLGVLEGNTSKTINIAAGTVS